MADVTKDMEGLDFSSDEDVANGDTIDKNKEEKPNKLKLQKSRSRLNKKKVNQNLTKLLEMVHQLQIQKPQLILICN